MRWEEGEERWESKLVGGREESGQWWAGWEGEGRAGGSGGKEEGER